MFDFSPNPELADQKKIKRRFKVVRVWIYISLILTPILALVSLGGGQPRTALPVETSSLPKGLNAASIAAKSWVNRSDLIELIEWTGFTDEAPSIELGFIIESHDFTVLVSGAPFVLRVPVYIDAEGYTFIPEDPVILPYVQGNQSQVVPNWRWPNALTTSNRPSWARSAESWLRAYISGDDVRMSEIIRDPDPTNIYVSLSGFTIDGSPRLSGLALRADGLGLGYLNALLIGPDGAEIPFSVDLLFGDIDSNSPSILAWGSPGTGEFLTPYQNAVKVTNRKIVPSSTTTTVLEDTGSSSPDTTPPSTTTPETTPPPSTSPTQDTTQSSSPVDQGATG